MNDRMLFVHMQVGDVRKVPYLNPKLGLVNLYKARTLCGLDITSCAATPLATEVTCPICRDSLLEELSKLAELKDQ